MKFALIAFFALLAVASSAYIKPEEMNNQAETEKDQSIVDKLFELVMVYVKPDVDSGNQVAEEEKEVIVQSRPSETYLKAMKAIANSTKSNKTANNSNIRNKTRSSSLKSKLSSNQTNSSTSRTKPEKNLSKMSSKSLKNKTNSSIKQVHSQKNPLKQAQVINKSQKFQNKTQMNKPLNAKPLRNSSKTLQTKNTSKHLNEKPTKTHVKKNKTTPAIPKNVHKNNKVSIEVTPKQNTTSKKVQSQLKHKKPHTNNRNNRTDLSNKKALKPVQANITETQIPKKHSKNKTNNRTKVQDNQKARKNSTNVKSKGMKNKTKRNTTKGLKKAKNISNYV